MKSNKCHVEIISTHSRNYHIQEKKVDGKIFVCVGIYKYTPEITVLEI